MTQKALVCEYEVAPAAVQAEAEGGEYSIQVSTVSSLCTWQASAHADWLSLSDAKGGGDATLTLTVQPNAGADARTTTLSIADHAVTVTQAGGDDYGDSCDTAGTVPLNTAVNGTLETVEDIDFFRIKTEQAGTLRAELQGAATYVVLFDEYCARLSEMQVKSRAEALEYAVQPGEYILAVGGDVEAGDYGLALTLETSGGDKADYTGWWYAPERSGTGLSLDVRDGVLYLAWYVYDEQGRAVWYSGWLEQGQGERFSGDLYAFAGWELGRPWHQAQPERVGLMELDFSETNATGKAALHWSLETGECGDESLQRYMEDISPGRTDARDLDGWWMDADYPGMGIFLETKGETLFMCWFHYREDGSPRWWTFGGPGYEGEFPAGEVLVSWELKEYAGGPGPGADYSPAEPLENGDKGALMVEDEQNLYFILNGGETFHFTPYVIEPVDLSGAEEFTLRSPAFAYGGEIPDAYTCLGKNISPPLTVVNTPKEAESLALIVESPQEPKRTCDWVHWVLYDIPRETQSLPEQVENWGTQGINDFAQTNYSGPCPQKGGNTYIFTLYALDTKLDHPPGLTASNLRLQMQGHILDAAVLLGVKTGE